MFSPRIIYLFTFIRLACFSIRFAFTTFSCLDILLLRCEAAQLNPYQTGSCRTDKVLFSSIRGLHKNFKDLVVANNSLDATICAAMLVFGYR